MLPHLVELGPAARAAVTLANGLIWLAFVVDYFTRLYLALDRREYVRRNIVDLLIVVIPFLRPLRALRLLRLLRVGAVAGVLTRRSASFHARAGAYVATTAVVALLLAAVAMYEAERDAPGANITTLPDAAWWAATTVSTVGYGDRYPTAAGGRLIAVALMVVGIALLGVITAAVAAWFVGRLRPVEEAEACTEATLEDVVDELQRYARASEVARVHTFRGYRDQSDGSGTKELTITVEEGIRDGRPEWTVTAVDEDGRTATGNPEKTHDVCLSVVHWNKLDG